MTYDISYYFDNCNSLSISDIREFIKLLCNEEIKKLNINTNINISFRDDINGYGGALINNFDRDSNGNLIIPLKTSGYTLEINDKDIQEKYKNCKDEVLEILPGVKIPKALNVLSSIASLCAHEVRHAFQCEQIKNNKFDSVESILWLKLELIRNEFDDIYEDNYEDFFTEQDAYNYQSTLPFSLIDKYSKLDGYAKEKYKEYLKEKGIVYCKNKDFKTYFKALDDPKRKRVATAYINELFNQIVVRLPKEYILNSLLKYEYNGDGTKKTFIELMKDKDSSKETGQNLDNLYDFIIDCDYNLQVQKLVLSLTHKRNDNISFQDEELILKTLKMAYHTQEFSYKQVHSTFQSRINKINKELGDLNIRTFRREINPIEASKKKLELFNYLQCYRNIERVLLNHIKDYKHQKEKYEYQEKLYSENMKLINNYKNRLGILDVVKDGSVIDVIDYNKLIATVIKDLNDNSYNKSYKEYLLKVKEVLIMQYKNNKKQK